MSNLENYEATRSCRLEALNKEIATLQHFADLCYDGDFRRAATQVLLKRYKSEFKQNGMLAHWEDEATTNFNGDFKLAYREIYTNCYIFKY